MESIKNYDVYTTGMEKSIEDKLFFIDMIHDIDAVIDFGCANGILLNEIQRKLPKCDLIGIDSDLNMLKMAKETIPNGTFIWYSGIDLYLCGKTTANTILNMSSVIHEVYSYSTVKEIRRFWEDVFLSGFKYISIRDLMLGEKAYRPVNQNELEKVISKSETIQINDFVKNWGSIELQSSLLHFLMKYRYLENWNREVRENYFPITVEKILSKIPTDLYKIKYFEHYMLPFNKQKIWEDFGIELNDNTHVKILLERK